MPATLQQLEVEGLPTRISRTNTPSDAPPVLVLHGWGASIDAVGSILNGLGATLDVIAVDLPGHGETATPPIAWTTADYARWTLALLDQLGVERCSIVAHSFGGRVTLQLMDQQPGRFARIVITGGAGLRPRRKPKYYVRVGIAKFGKFVGRFGGPLGRRWQDRMRRRVASEDWLNASEEIRGTLRNVLGEDLRPLLPGVTVPTLLLWGTHDEDAPLWMAKVMAEEMPDAALVELDGGHFAYAERAAEFNTIAAHFLQAAR